MSPAQLGDLMNQFTPLQNHFNRYLMIGGFPELVLSDDDAYAQRMLREDVVDKVIKRDVLTLFNIRSPLLMEKLFLYLCMNSTEIFNATTAAKELENTSVTTIDSYIRALEMSNLIYLAKPMNVGSKGALKGKSIVDTLFGEVIVFCDYIQRCLLRSADTFVVFCRTLLRFDILLYFFSSSATEMYQCPEQRKADCSNSRKKQGRNTNSLRSCCS